MRPTTPRFRPVRLRTHLSRLVALVASTGLVAGLLTAVVVPPTAQATAGILPVGPNADVLSFAPDGVGGVYAGGAFWAWGSQTGGLAAVAPNDAALDQSFPWTDGTVDAIVGDGAGGYYIGGSFDVVGGQYRENLAHIDASGAVTDFAASTNEMVIALERIGNTLYVGGRFDEVTDGDGNTDYDRNLLGAVDVTAGGGTGTWLAWDPDVTADTGVAGNWWNNYNLAVFALKAVGTTLYVGGSFDTINSATTADVRAGVAAFDVTAPATPTLDADWNPDLDGPVLAIAARTNTIVLGGQFENVNAGESDGATSTSFSGVGRESLAEVWPVGRTDTDSPPNDIAGLATTEPLAVEYEDTSQSPPVFYAGIVYALAVNGSEVLVGGDYTVMYTGSDPYPGVARDNLAAYSGGNGSVTATVATSWNPSAADGSVAALAVGSSGEVYVGGSFETISGTPRNGLAKYASTSTNTFVAGWDAGLDSDVEVIGLDSGKVVVGGGFAVAGSTPVNGLVHLDANGQRDTSFTPNVTGYVSQVRLWNGRLYAVVVGWDSVAYQETYDLLAYDLSTGTGTALVSLDGPVTGLASTTDRLFVVGEFQNVTVGQGSPVAQPNAFALDTSDALTGWAPTLAGVASAVLVDGTSVYLAGTDPSVGIGGLPYLVRASASGSGALDNTWTPDFTAAGSAQYGAIYALAMWNGDLAVGGRMLNSTSSSDDGKALVGVSTTTASQTWTSDINGRGYVRTLTPTSAGMLVGGTGDLAPDGGSAWQFGVALYSSPSTFVAWQPTFEDASVQAVAVVGSVVFIGGDTFIADANIAGAGFASTSPRFSLALAPAHGGGGGGGGGGSGSGGSTPGTPTTPTTPKPSPTVPPTPVPVPTTVAAPVIRRFNVYFATGSATVSRAQLARIRAHVTAITARAGTPTAQAAALVQVSGATAAQRTLARQRGNAVAKALVAAGVAGPVRVRVVPMRTTGTWRDRRVEVTLRATRTTAEPTASARG